MAETSFDVVFIGGGPGGYTGAIRSAQLGMKVGIIEKYKTLGGTCLNVGCIPSKALLDSSEHFEAANHDLANHGVRVSGVSLDLNKMMERKLKIVKDLTSGVDFLMKKNKIERMLGIGKIISPNEVEIIAEDGSKTKITSKNIVIATGSDVADLPFMKIDKTHIISSTEALKLESVPKHLIVVGGGVIGLELGSVWKRLGAKVTVIEYADRIASMMDAQMTTALTRSLKKQGMEFVLKAKVTGYKVNKKGKDHEVVVTYEDMATGETKEIAGDKVLLSVGRKPYTEGLGLENLGIETDKRGFIQVNDHYQTKYPNIFAIGDVIPGPMLAHKAEEEGVAVAETLAGQAGHVNYETVPSVIYTWPELASVGLTEEQVKEKGTEYKVGTFPFTANGRAKAIGMTDGMVKVIADKVTDKVLGVHIVGPRASDMLAEAVIAMEFSASAEDIARTFHAHPTLSEVMREAALNVDKLARQA
jgi:dihydrolipoamide dehydrogenase